MRSAIAMPTRVAEALAERAGGGLDAGGQCRARGGRASRLPHWRKRLQLVERQVVAGEVQQRVEQHRAVAGREHEAVAVGPRRIGGVVTRKRVQSTDATSAMPMGMPGWPDLAFCTASMARTRRCPRPGGAGARACPLAPRAGVSWMLLDIAISRLVHPPRRALRPPAGRRASAAAMPRRLSAATGGAKGSWARRCACAAGDR